MNTPGIFTENSRGRRSSGRPANRAATAATAGGPQPWDPLLICAAGYIVTAAARLHTLVGPISALRPTLLFAALGFLLYLKDRHPARAIRLLKGPLAYLVLFLIVWGTLGAPFALYFGRAARFLLDEFYKVGILFLLVAGAVRDLHDVRRLLLAYALGALVFATNSSLNTVGFRALSVGGYDANDAAMFVVSAIPLAVYFLIRARSLVIRIAIAAGIVFCTLTIVKSGSRGAFLAFIVVGVFLLFFFRGVRPAFRVLAVGAVITVFLVVSRGESDYWSRMNTLTSLDEDYNATSLTGRTFIWRRGAGYMLNHPILGVGIDNFPIAEGQHPIIAARIAMGRGTKYSAAHSSWVQIGAELGIPGLLAFMATFGVSIMALYRLTKQSRASPSAPPLFHEGAAMGAALIGVLLGLAVAGSFLSQAYGYPTWAVFGLTAGLLKVMRRPPSERSSATGGRRALNHGTVYSRQLQASR